MATLAQNATDIAACATAIDNAIVAKGGTLVGGGKLRNAAAGIASITSGGDASGSGLPYGCPRIDLIQIATGFDEVYVVFFTDEDTSSVSGFFDNTVQSYRSETLLVEVNVMSDGRVVETSNTSSGRPASLNFTGKGYHVVRYRNTMQGARYKNATFLNTLINVKVIATSGCINEGSELYAKIISDATVSENSEPYISTEVGTCTTIIVDRPSILQRAAFRNGTSLNYISLKQCKCVGNSFEYLFSNIKSNVIIDFSGLDISPITSTSGFEFPSKCMYVRFPSDSNKGPRISLNISGSNVLSHDSLISVINSLYDHVSAESETTPTLTIGATNLAKLTDVEKAIATDKGWTLA